MQVTNALSAEMELSSRQKRFVILKEILIVTPVRVSAGTESFKQGSKHARLKETHIVAALVLPAKETTLLTPPRNALSAGMALFNQTSDVIPL